MPRIAGAAAPLSVLLLVAGCLGPRPIDPIAPSHASSEAYAYQPVNPITTWVTPDPDVDPSETPSYNHAAFSRAVLSDTVNEAVRVATARIDASGAVTFGPVAATAQGENAALVVDYITYVTRSEHVAIIRASGGAVRVQELGREYTAELGDGESLLFEGAFPVYVGVGLRLRADYTATEGQVRAPSLPSVGLEAQAGRIVGTLTVQTLGVTGEAVSGLLPIQSDLSPSSIQNALQAIGAIKAKMYEPETVVSPVVVGLESPLTDRDAVVALVGYVYQRDYTIQVRQDPPGPDEPDGEPRWSILWTLEPYAD
ncbi:MAG: hypothetical protein AAF612_11150 [Planctomycetota bacterium]